MLLSWARKFLNRQDAPAPVVPPGMRIYAVGDIHGRLDLLNGLLNQIEVDSQSGPENVLTVFLGDYVDRGPDSSGVLERLATGPQPTPFCTLRGNHEEMVLNFFEDPDLLNAWRKYGGLEFLHSYGVDVSDIMRGQGYEKARDALKEKMPARHREFLEQTRHFVTYGDYFFCHAGIRPGVPCESQSPSDLLWIREDFLRFEGKSDKIVVHGHTPVAQPEIRQNRINVDTGAFATSVLTALVLENAERRFLSAGASV